MFNTLIESQGKTQLTRNAFSLAGSLLLHATMALGLLAAPLFFLEPKAGLLRPAPPPPSLKLGSSSGAVEIIDTGHQSSSQNTSCRLAIPRTVSLVPIFEDTASPPIGVAGESLLSSLPGGSGGLDCLGVPGGVPEPRAQSFVPPEPPVTAQAAEVHAIQVRRGGEVQQANLIRLVKPEYPFRRKWLEFRVVWVLEAVISTDGNVSRLNVVSGHPLLIDAAIRAVQQWKYRPTLLNRVPVEVLTQITINFALGQ